MTKDEIKRALKMCADTCFRVCCPYGAAINCCGKLKRDALDLITEQENEIKKQNGRVKCLKTRLANKMVLLSNVEDLYESETQKLKEEKQELKTALKQSEDNYSRAFERLKAQEREIGKLKAENEALKNDLINSEGNLNHITTEFKQLQIIAEILARVVRGLNRENYELTEKVKHTKIDMLNEIKARCVETFVGKKIISAVDIDKIIKEIEEQ